VRINIPLLPILIEIRWRPLGPFQFTLRGLMLLVVIVGVFFALAAQTVRLHKAGSYHAEQTVRASLSRSKSPPYGPTPLELWHAKLSRDYHNAASLTEFITAMIFLTLVALGVVAVLGRIVHRLDRRPSLPPRELAGVVLGLALSLGSARVVAVTGGVEVHGAARRAQPGRAEAGPNDEPAKWPTLTVRGLVIDAATKRPIALFRVIPGALNGHGATWQPHLITAHQHGLFELPPTERAWDETRFRVEAEGYRPAVSRIVKKLEGEVKLTFALQADPGISAIVRTPDGAPAARAQAIWTTVSREATGRGATITPSGRAESLGARVVTADAAGRFRLPPESAPGTILVAHRSGYAEINPADLKASGVVRLGRWCRVEGRVLAGTKPVVGQKVRIYRCWSPPGESPTHTWEDEAVTDADGWFACDRVIQGRQVIDRVFSAGAVEGMVNGLATYIEVREGRTTRISLGGPGRTLVGRFEPPKDLGLPIDWSKVRFHLGLKAPHIGFPGDEPIWETYRAFLNTEEGKAYFRDNLPAGRDGTFRIESVPPGDCLLSIWVFGPAVCRQAEPQEVYASGHKRIEVNPTWDERSEERQSLGTINLRRNTRNP
jgi:hypothetical protein